MFYFLWSYTAEIRDRKCSCPGIPPAPSASSPSIKESPTAASFRRLFFLIFDARRAPHRRCHRDVLFFHLRHIIRRFHHPIGRRSSGQNDFKPLPVPLYENAQPFSADHLSLRGGNNFVQYEEVRLLQNPPARKLLPKDRNSFPLPLSAHARSSQGKFLPEIARSTVTCGICRKLSISPDRLPFRNWGENHPPFAAGSSQSQSGGRRRLAFSVAVATDESYQCSLIPRRATKSIQSCSIAHSFRLSQLAVKKP